MKRNLQLTNVPIHQIFPSWVFFSDVPIGDSTNVSREKFQEDAGMESPEHYWIHADAGGTPLMADRTVAPNYCYHDKKVRLMGWSAHGDKCGGFGPGVGDDERKYKGSEF